MYQPIEGVVLRLTKYNDRNTIVTLYTRQLGRIGCLTPAGNGREATRRRALLMPLMAVEALVDSRHGRELTPMRDVRPLIPMPSLTADPRKAMIALFIADVFNAALREQQPDEAMWAFVASTATQLDAIRRGLANFHLQALMRMQRFLGIEPDWSSWAPGLSLDMTEGLFNYGPVPGHAMLSPDDTAAAHLLSRMNPRTLHLFRLNRNQRNAIVDNLIRYYSLHDVNLSSIKSLDILRDLELVP